MNSGIEVEYVKIYIQGPMEQGRSYGGGGPRGGRAPHKLSVPPPGAPPQKKKIMHTYFFYLPISRVCNTLLPTNIKYALLKYALNCLFVIGCSSTPIHIARNSTFIM